MTNLTEAQRLILLSACEHDLGLATRPAKLKGASAEKIASALIERGLAKEVRAKVGVPVWRQDEGRDYALKILKAGRDAVMSRSPEKMLAGTEAASSPANGVIASITGPKAALIVGLMRRTEGASLQVLIKATGWLPHTTRAVLSGLRKKGVVIERSIADQGGGSIYRIRGVVPSSKAA